MQYCYFDSPIGALLLAGQNESLNLIGFSNGRLSYKPTPEWVHNPQIFKNWVQQLYEYFKGKRHKFDLPYYIQATDFQKRVLNSVAKVPYGKTKAYSEIATQIGQPNAARAVGMANARNPLPIVIPCHRIIGKNNSLTGFGGGIKVKQYLLELEQKHQ